MSNQTPATLAQDAHGTFHVVEAADLDGPISLPKLPKLSDWQRRAMAEAYRRGPGGGLCEVTRIKEGDRGFHSNYKAIGLPTLNALTRMGLLVCLTSKGGYKRWTLPQ